MSPPPSSFGGFGPGSFRAPFFSSANRECGGPQGTGVPLPQRGNRPSRRPGSEKGWSGRRRKESALQRMEVVGDLIVGGAPRQRPRFDGRVDLPLYLSAFLGSGPGGRRHGFGPSRSGPCGLGGRRAPRSRFQKQRFRAHGPGHHGQGFTSVDSRGKGPPSRRRAVACGGTGPGSVTRTTE